VCLCVCVFVCVCVCVCERERERERDACVYKEQACVLAHAMFVSFATTP